MFVSTYIHSFIHSITFKHLFRDMLSISWAGKESTCNAGDPSSISGSGRFAGERIGYPLPYSWGSLVAQLVKNPPAMWETWVRSLGWEDPLEKGKATHSSILAWRTPWSVESMGLQRVWRDWATFTFTETGSGKLANNHLVAKESSTREINGQSWRIKFSVKVRVCYWLNVVKCIQK